MILAKDKNKKERDLELVDVQVGERKTDEGVQMGSRPKGDPSKGVTSLDPHWGLTTNPLTDFESVYSKNDLNVSTVVRSRVDEGSECDQEGGWTSQELRLYH